ncbi:hypothetical protein [Pseudomonas sp. Ant30-3]|uniref:hypothetical protein n=1 Tax=Pseudomonas sp. Ant30-3 TaxID=1488328 RepID=UPI00048C7E2A|nr:hypothetical protein [Pseudomonas sp. Ant30-3]
MNIFRSQTLHHADSFVEVGIALIAIADLLGADYEDHNLTESQSEGLAQAARVLGQRVRDQGYALSLLASEKPSKQSRSASAAS